MKPTQTSKSLVDSPNQQHAVTLDYLNLRVSLRLSLDMIGLFCAKLFVANLIGFQAFRMTFGYPPPNFLALHPNQLESIVHSKVY